MRPVPLPLPLVLRWLATLLCLLLLLWLLLLGVFLSNTEYTRRETVRGWLEPRDGVIGIYPSREGKLARLLVSEGDSVTENQALAVINGDLSLTDGKHLEELLLAEYREPKLDEAKNDDQGAPGRLS